MYKTGSRIGHIGSVITVVTASIQYFILIVFMFLIEAGTFIEDVGLAIMGWDYLPFTLPLSLTLGVISLIGAKKAKKNKQIGFIILVVCGVILGVGVNIIIAPGRIVQEGWAIPLWVSPVPLINSLLYFDPYLITLGGVMGLLSLQKEPINNSKDEKSKEIIES